MRSALPILFVALVLSSCASSGGDEPVSDLPASDAPRPPTDGASAGVILVIQEGAIASGPGIGVNDAIGQAGGEPVLVNGALFIDPDGDVLLCEAIAESFPPQCGGARLAWRTSISPE